MPLKKDGVMIILSSPSGAGKTTLVKLLSEKNNFEISISHTTRSPRPNENHSKDYFFVSENEFKRLIKNEEFLEYAKVFENFYGSTRSPVISNLNELCKNTSISLFVDNLKNNNTNLDAIDYALKVGANTIEIHTGEFSKLIDLNDLTINTKLEELICSAKDKNLMVNAGHDLNLINLPHLVKIGGVNEVSIGHAIVVDALNYGFEDTIKRYIEVIKG